MSQVEQQPIQDQPRSDNPLPEVKEPMIAGIASLIVPGAGQVYNEQFKRGLVILGAVVALDLLFFVLGTIGSFVILGAIFFLGIPLVHMIAHPAAAYDAYTQAPKVNSGEAPKNTLGLF